jgi:hypothetical protein
MLAALAPQPYPRFAVAHRALVVVPFAHDRQFGREVARSSREARVFEIYRSALQGSYFASPL